MGSFRPVAGNRRLHRYHNFTELMAETAPRSLHHSCRSELTRQGISLPQDRSSYGRRLLGLRFNASPPHGGCHPLLTFQHRAGVRHYTSSYDFAKPYVFAKQSPGPFHCGCSSLRQRPLSRSYRAILPSSLAMNHSSTLGSSPRLPVSVYGTGYHNLKLSGFSWKSDYLHYLRPRRFAVLSELS